MEKMQSAFCQFFSSTCGKSPVPTVHSQADISAVGRYVAGDQLLAVLDEVLLAGLWCSSRVLVAGIDGVGQGVRFNCT